MTTTRYSGEPNYERFTLDMEAAGLNPYDYQGRFFYHGPAVNVSDLQVAIRATTVEVQWDHLGLGFVVYPK